MNISSVVVHPRPGHAEKVRALLEEMEGVEVHAVSPEGKMIVTIETSTDGEVADKFESISKTDDVLSVSMIFHQSESDPDKEICNETDAA